MNFEEFILLASKLQRKHKKKSTKGAFQMTLIYASNNKTLKYNIKNDISLLEIEYTVKSVY